MQGSSEGIEGFNLALRRADQVIAVSVSNHGADAGPGLEHTLNEPPRADVGEKDGTLTFVTLRLPSLRPASASERTTCGTAAWRAWRLYFLHLGRDARCSLRNHGHMDLADSPTSPGRKTYLIAAWASTVLLGQLES